MSQQQDLETVVNALLKGIKSQPTKTPVKHITWIEKRFGLPKSGEEVLWRICWLMVVPAIIFNVWMPIARWCFVNGLPMVPILVTVVSVVLYGLIAQMTVNAAGEHSGLVELQLNIPLGVIFFLFVWELLSHA